MVNSDMTSTSRCPRCGKQKQPQYRLCYTCNQEDKKPKKNQVSSKTAHLKQLMIKRQKTDEKPEKKRPISIKEWINTDVKEWGELLEDSDE